MGSSICRFSAIMIARSRSMNYSKMLVFIELLRAIPVFY